MSFLYETVPAHARLDDVTERLKNNTLNYITFGSSSTVDNFFARIPEELVRESGVRLACIGPVTAKTLNDHGLQAAVMPETFTIPALVDAIVRDTGEKA